jgi:hypothetical protein
MTDLDRIRALCQSFIEEAEHQRAEVGEAGAHDALLRADSCRVVIKAIDAFPALTSVDRIPPMTRLTIDNYAQHGLQPGSGIRAVLEGNLFTAMARCDEETIIALPAIVRYINDALHPSIYGSPEGVSRWIAKVRA